MNTKTMLENKLQLLSKLIPHSIVTTSLETGKIEVTWNENHIKLVDNNNDIVHVLKLDNPNECYKLKFSQLEHYFCVQMLLDPSSTPTDQNLLKLVRSIVDYLFFASFEDGMKITFSDNQNSVRLILDTFSIYVTLKEVTVTFVDISETYHYSNFMQQIQTLLKQTDEEIKLIVNYTNNNTKK